GSLIGSRVLGSAQVRRLGLQYRHGLCDFWVRLRVPRTRHQRGRCDEAAGGQETNKKALAIHVSGLLYERRSWNEGSARLRRVHWSKEASSLGCAFIYWSPYWNQWIIDATVEAIIRRWGCHVGGNDFISRWQGVITIRRPLPTSRDDRLKSGLASAAETVSCEPVSANKFSANREFNRELRKFRASAAISASNQRANSKACSQIPYATEQGIFAAITRNFFAITGNLIERAAKPLSCCRTSN